MSISLSRFAAKGTWNKEALAANVLAELPDQATVIYYLRINSSIKTVDINSSLIYVLLKLLDIHIAY